MKGYVCTSFCLLFTFVGKNCQVEKKDFQLISAQQMCSKFLLLVGLCIVSVCYIFQLLERTHGSALFTVVFVQTVQTTDYVS